MNGWNRCDQLVGKCFARPSARAFLACGLIIGMATAVDGQIAEQQTVQAAATAFDEVFSTAITKIPASMLSECHGVAIVPNVVKGGFIVGARHGKGLLFVRDAKNGVWHAPVFISLTGGNIGWQAGIQSSDIVLVFRTERSINGILSGKLTIGGDASAAAGPLGRGTSVGTDGRLQAEIYTYSRSRGLFAGVAIDGSVLRTDPLATAAYYQTSAPGQLAVVPPEALQLTQKIASYTNPTVASVEPTSQLRYAQQQSVNEPDALRDQLLRLAPELFKILDPQWQQYLALPFVTVDGSPPPMNLVQETIRRYDMVAGDPKYRELAAHPEFRSVHGLLKHYEHSLAPGAPKLQLPPPPAVVATPASAR
ncbi:MAG: lipid-binding SYLF domain-containing protein [Planctomycetota bacterium]